MSSLHYWNHSLASFTVKCSQPPSPSHRGESVPKGHASLGLLWGSAAPCGTVQTHCRAQKINSEVQ